MQNFRPKFRIRPARSRPVISAQNFATFFKDSLFRGVRKLEIICLSESDFNLKFWFQVVFKQTSSFCFDGCWHEIVAFWVRVIEFLPHIYIYIYIYIYQRVICLSETSENRHDTRDQRESLRGRAPRNILDKFL